MQGIRESTISYINKHAFFRNQLDWETSWIHLTTITFTTKMTWEIDITQVKEHFGDDGRVQIGGWEWILKTGDKEFFNQVTIKYQDDFSTKSIKLFTNGSIQVAGATDLFDCERVCTGVEELLGRVTKKKWSRLSSQPFKVAMINTNFNVNFSLNLRMVQQVFGNTCRVSFDPDRYSAVKLKFAPGEGMKQVTASVFSTGKIIVTGAMSLDEIVCSYGFLTQTIKENRTVLARSQPKPDKGDELFMGASYPQWIEAIKNI